jgi:hypothetical protein
MCVVEEEPLSALSFGVDEDEVELLALTTNKQDAITEDSAYRVPVSLKAARKYMNELKYI